MDGFLRRGLTTACLKAAGTEPELRQVLKVRRQGLTLLKTSFNTLAGITSQNLPHHLREEREVQSCQTLQRVQRGHSDQHLLHRYLLQCFA